MKTPFKLIICAALVVVTSPALAHQSGSGSGSGPGMKNGMMAEGLMMPQMDAVEGRKLFADKGCVVCHAINGVGGEDAPALDAGYMEMPMNPFDFAARMWRGAGAMVALQEEEMGGQIELDGEELAAIIAFVHDADEQKKFTDADIPDAIKAMMHHESEADHHAEGEEDDHG